MKTILYSVLFMALSLPLAIEAQQITSEQIIGTWLFNYDASFAKMEAKVKSQYDSISVERKTKIDNSYKGRTLIFNADGSIVQNLSDGRTAKGTWVYNDKTKNIEITNPKGLVYYQKVKSFTSTSLVLEAKAIGSNQPIISEMHFTKI